MLRGLFQRSICSASGKALEVVCSRCRPGLMFTIGLLFKPIGRLTSRNMPGRPTLALYGFESIIWGRQPAR